MRSTVFGLDVESEAPLLLLGGTIAGPTGRTLRVSLHDRPPDLDWPEPSERISDDYQPDGTLVYRIERHPEAGFLIAGPSFGAHVLSPDGRTLRCATAGLAEHEWQRLVVAQALPFAALLHGLEVFHASAVVQSGRAIAFLGGSGTGKTSIALELHRRGAGFLADDVVALEPRGGLLLAHPGTALAGITRSETTAPDHPPYMGEPVAITAREQLARVAGEPQAAPLGALLFLDRRGDGPAQPIFEPAPDPRLLLSATFNFVLATPERLGRLLETSALAARAHVERVIYGPSVGVAELANAIAEHLNAWR